ncbi:MAG: Fic family protein [Polyangiales bacterium]
MVSAERACLITISAVSLVALVGLGDAFHGAIATNADGAASVARVATNRRSPVSLGSQAAIAGWAGDAARLARESAAFESAVGGTSKRVRALEIMQRSSLEVSRTVSFGRNLPEFQGGWTAAAVSDLATDNFTRTAAWVVERAHELPLNLDTATQINERLTRGLIPDGVAGTVTYNRNPSALYDWLASAEAKDLERTDPVALASRVHDLIGAYDAFPDGNGRTSRLMADLVLLKNDRAPAFYTGIDDYFRRGNARASVSKGERLAYFREAVERGEAAMREHHLPLDAFVEHAGDARAANQYALDLERTRLRAAVAYARTQISWGIGVFRANLSRLTVR